MFLSIATTHRPASDLGFLLMKHPDRTHVVELGFGTATVLFPEASEERCEAVLLLDIDPVELVRGRGRADGLLDQYVNDRPYAASSFLAVALNRAFRTAMAGTSRDRPALAATPIALTIRVEPVPVRNTPELVGELFEPLGWMVAVDRLAGLTQPSRYARVTLTGTLRLADALTQLYVLIPVLDEDKHYWVGEDEVEKLLAKGESWLPRHPARELIARRYLKRRRDLTRLALGRLAPEIESEAATLEPEALLEAPVRLHEQRLDAVAGLLADSGAASVADLGCGEGKLLSRLAANPQFKRIVGLDASSVALSYAKDRLKLDRSGGNDGRIVLLHGALTYRDARWEGVDAVALVEVIEHLDADRLPSLVEVVFGRARPATVVITTPNADYNALFPALDAGAFRHPDHRFEWSRVQARDWSAAISSRYGYGAELGGIGDVDPEHGAPTQLLVFRR